MLDYAQKHKMIRKIEDGLLLRTEDKKGLQKIHFCKNLMQCYIDSYHLVAESIYSLMGLGVDVAQEDLINYLSKSVLILYQKGAVGFINSSFAEILEVAFGRFAELGICNR